MLRTCTHIYTYEHLYRSRWNAHALLAVCRRISVSASFFAWQASVHGVDEKSLEPEAKSWPPHGPKQINKHTCFWQLTSLSGPDRHRAMPANGSEATFGRRENYTKISFVKQSRGSREPSRTCISRCKSPIWPPADRQHIGECSFWFYCFTLISCRSCCRVYDYMIMPVPSGIQQNYILVNKATQPFQLRILVLKSLS